MNQRLVLATAVAAMLAACDAKTSEAVPPAADAQVASAPTGTDGVPVPVIAEPVQAPAPARATAPQYANTYPVPRYAAGSDPDDEPPPIYTDYEPALEQPAPIAVPWAPPPMLVEAPPPPPYSDARWTGGYWVWRDRWVWAPGRWARPPRPEYHWVPPYYEHRSDRVVFVDGFWASPHQSFVPPAPTLTIALAVVGAGIAPGRAPVGPEGVFVPAPPGSRRGLFVMAPVGTPPAVVTGAPPIIAPGMRVSANVTNIDRTTNNVNKTTVDNNRNSTVVNNITNVTIVAPPGSTADHRAVNVSVPAQAHLAAAAPPVLQTRPVEAAPSRPMRPLPPAAAAAPPPATAVAPPTPPANVDNTPHASAARRPDDRRKGIEPVDRSRASAQAVHSDTPRNPPPSSE